MPAKRLPWFKLWIGCTSHGKVRQLDDGTFRTWVELLDAAAQQPMRGRFASRAEAVAITRRPTRHVAALVAAGLLDESDEGVWLHDWSEWQDVYPSDVSRERSAKTPRTPGDDSPNTPRTPGDDSPKKREGRSKKRDGDVDPPAPSERAPRGGRRMAEVDEAFKQTVEDEFWEALGSRAAVRDSIAAALNHKARLKYTDQRAYLRNWLRIDAGRAVQRHLGPAPPGPNGACQNPGCYGDEDIRRMCSKARHLEVAS